MIVKVIDRVLWRYMSKEDKSTLLKQAAEMYLNGSTMKEIATAYHVTITTVWRWLISMGVPRRLGGYQKLYGNKHPNWKGGKSHGWGAFARMVLLNADINICKCMECGVDEIELPLQIHHKDGNRCDNNIENLEVLCQKCHKSNLPNARHSVRRQNGRFSK